MTVASETTARTTLSSSEDRKKFHRTDAFDHIDYHIPEKIYFVFISKEKGHQFFLEHEGTFDDSFVRNTIFLSDVDHAFIFLSEWELPGFNSFDS